MEEEQTLGWSFNGRFCYDLKSFCVSKRICVCMFDSLQDLKNWVSCGREVNFYQQILAACFLYP